MENELRQHRGVHWRTGWTSGRCRGHIVDSIENIVQVMTALLFQVMHDVPSLECGEWVTGSGF